MPRIKYVKPEEATGSVAESYRKLKENVTQGSVPMNTAMFSLKPRLLDIITDLQIEMRSPDWKLSRAHREMLATVTSALNRCEF